MTALTEDQRAEMRRCAEAAKGKDFSITVPNLPQWLCDWFAVSDQRNVIALLDENDELRRERDGARIWLDNANQASGEFENRWFKSESDLAALRSLAKKMAAALEPFAEADARWADHWSDDEVVDEEGFVLGSIRRASRVLASYRSSVGGADRG